MKKFRFTLSALHTVRQRLEKAALEDYAHALQGQKAAQDQLRTVLDGLEATWKSRQDKLSVGATAETLAQIQAYCQYLEICRRQAETILEKAEDIVRQKWQIFLQARRQREIVDKFHDRQRQRYDRDCAREEQKLLDELGHRPTLSDTFSGPNENASTWN